MTGAPCVKLGLTGSIAMGKSTTAQMFRDAGIPVWDADATVHRLYQSGQPGAEAIRALAPDAIVDGAVDRGRLSAAIQAKPELLGQIEAAIHPLVAADRTRFTEETRGDILLFDIPLLFETGGDATLDAIVVVTAPESVQTARALARPGMTPEKLTAIRARQMPDAEKRARADFLIDTSEGLEAAREAVHSVLETLRSRPHA